MPDPVEPPDSHDLIVMAASAGGMNVLTALLAQLPADLPAAVCVVQHLAPQSPGTLATIIGRDSRLPAQEAGEAMPLEPGHIYVAPPNRHLLIEPGRLRLWYGPRENRSRPAVDPLFRSAASAYGARAVGVVLSGALDDGTYGLRSIKEAGGAAVVQDPADAPYPSMPQSALNYVRDVDYVLPVREMSTVLERLARTPPAQPPPSTAPPMPPDDDQQSAASAADDTALRTPSPGPPSSGSERRSDAPGGVGASDDGPLANMGCPACGGPLREVSSDGPRSYHCHIGHRYTAQALLEDQNDAVERALWIALRTLEERRRMLDRMARDAHTDERSTMTAQYDERAGETGQHAERIRALLARFGEDRSEVPPLRDE